MKRTIILTLALIILFVSPVLACHRPNCNHTYNEGGTAIQGQIGINRNTNVGVNRNNNTNANKNVGINRNKNANENNNKNTNVGINKNQNKNTNVGVNKNYNQDVNVNSDYNSNRQGQMQGQDQDQKQGQAQAQEANNTQGQSSMQGQAQDASNSQGQSNTISIDGDEVNSYSFAPPALNAQKGTEATNAYSIFGGVGFSQTEEYTVTIEKISVIERMEKLGYLSAEEARAEARYAFAQLKDATKPKRVLGFLWKTRGRHLGNVLGLLSMDSLVEYKPTKSKIADNATGAPTQNFTSK